MAKTRPRTNNAWKKPPTAQSSARGLGSDIRLKGLICLLLVVATLVAYWQVSGCEFIDCYDDQLYVTSNPSITKGLGSGSLTWAFTTFSAGNWHPLTWLSYMADYQMYGLDPGGYHVTNLLFHIANTLILFLLLSWMTGAVWKSAFVAALFAVHPLHVESVAWVAERKDLLSTFFFLITIYAYTLYARRPSIARYIPVVVAFGLGLMCKPMLVSLPLVLLLLDYWPLDRAVLRWRLVWEKAPLFAMSIGSCVITVVAQRLGGAMAGLDTVPFGLRLENAAVSYVAYALKMVWPSRLAVFYPLPAVTLPLWEVVSASLALVAATILAIQVGRRHRYLTVGWLWYLITLVPVIGILQVGWQSMADRYTYITLTGLFIVVAWGVPDIVARRGSAIRRLLPASAAALILILSVCTWFQVRYWHDSLSLFDHAVRVTTDNYLAYNNRGAARMQLGMREEAMEDFTRAIEIRPDFAEAQNNIGLYLIETGNLTEGIAHVRIARSHGLDTAALRQRIALEYFKERKLDLAIEECRRALRLDPKSAVAHNLMGMILGRQGRLDECISSLNTAAALDPNYADPHANLAVAYFAKQDYTAAWREAHLLLDKGGQPNPQFIAALSARMPDPGQ